MCLQWRIQDFPPGGGANPRDGDANLLFYGMKMKEIGLGDVSNTKPKKAWQI